MISFLYRFFRIFYSFSGFFPDFSVRLRDGMPRYGHDTLRIRSFCGESENPIAWEEKSFRRDENGLKTSLRFLSVIVFGNQ